MSLKSFVKKRIDGLSILLEAFDGNSLAKGCYRYLKKCNSKSFVTVYKEPYIYSCGGSVYKGFENIGIVLQGPVMHEDNFTIETIRIIREWYPEIRIVLSTWFGSLTDKEKEWLNNYNCRIIESNDLGGENKGTKEKTGHLNNQLLSSRLGLEFLEREGIKYALKLRSDVRLYKTDFVPYLLTCLEVYKKADLNLINVAFSNSLYNIPFHMSDFIWFGDIEHMLKMYSVSYREDETLSYIRDFVNSNEYDRYKEEFAYSKKRPFELNTKWYEESKLDKEFLVNYHEEIYIPYNFWCDESNNHSDNLLFDYYKFLSRIIVLDDRDLLVYWNKYLYSIIQSDYSYKEASRLRA